MKDTIKDLADRLALLHVRHQVAFIQISIPANPAYLTIAESLDAGLQVGDPDAAARVRGVVDPGDLSRSEFWATPLGRLLFLAGGYSGKTCTQTVAAGVLGCSRQWVSAMVAEGKLTTAPGRGVYAAEVRGVLLHRAERLRVQEAHRHKLDDAVNDM
jgi:hypothetical protein